MVTAAVNKLNNTEAGTQPYFTPTDTLKSLDVLPPATTTAFISSCRAASMVKNLAGQPNFLSTSHNSVLFTVPKALRDLQRLHTGFGVVPCIYLAVGG